MSISGNLRTMPFADLLQWLSQSRKTGTLMIEGKPYNKKVFFREGGIVAVSSENPKEFLGYFLVGWDLVGEDELQELLDMQDRHGALLGELLLIIGRLTRQELVKVLRTKTEETIYDLFLWEEASFRFLEEVLPQKKFIPLELPVDLLIFEGVRREDEWEQIRVHVSDATWVPRLTGEADAGQLEPADAEILALVDGERSIERIALARRTGVFNVLHLVSRCIQSRFLEVSAPRSGAKMEIPGFSSSSWKRMLKEVEDHLGGGELLAAFRGLRGLRRKYPNHVELLQRVAALEQRVSAAVDSLGLDDSAVLELAISARELTVLSCGPEEGFLLSRINGTYSLGDVLKVVPSSATEVRLIVNELIQREVVRVKSTP